MKEIRRTTQQGVAMITPTISINFNNNRIAFSRQTLELMNFDRDKQAVMFFIGNGKAKFKIEDKAYDNYSISKTNLFVNKNICQHFKEAFEIDKNTAIFEVTKDGDDYLVNMR